MEDYKKMLTVKLILSILGVLIGITSIVLTFIWFGWKLALILFLAEWSSNTTKKVKEL